MNSLEELREKEQRAYNKVENTTMQDNNGNNRNIAGILKNYAFNKLCPNDLKCTTNQYYKFLDQLDEAEMVINKRSKK